jgi:hypothetical protein
VWNTNEIILKAKSGLLIYANKAPIMPPTCASIMLNMASIKFSMLCLICKTAVFMRTKERQKKTLKKAQCQ